MPYKLPNLQAEIAIMSKKTPSVLNLDKFSKEKDKQPDFYIKTFQSHRAEHPFVMEPHSHDFYLLMIFTKGTGKHTIDLINYNVKPGSVFFMNPGQVHSWKLSEDADGYILFFNSFFYTMNRQETRINSFPFYGTNKLHALDLNKKQLKDIEPLFNLLNAENRIASLVQHSILRALLDALLFKLSFFIEPDNTATTNISIIPKLESLIEQYYKEHLPSSFYADQLNISLQRMNMYTKNYLNKTVTDLLNERLLNEAKRLLVYTDKSVSEIAYDLNFNDNSYFNRFFKRSEKETPEQFRKRFK